MEKTYTIGLDYGTLSVRAVLLDTAEGTIVSEASAFYPSGVIEGSLSTCEKLPEGMSLQDPADYLSVLPGLMRDLFAHHQDAASRVAGIGVDFTSCTLLPVDSHLCPLSMKDEFAHHPQAWCKLWKSHSAQPWADRINEVLSKEDPELLSLYGGSVSSEWTLPKMLETFHADPQVWQAADSFLEAGDYVVNWLTGRSAQDPRELGPDHEILISSCGAGYKALWHEPDPERIARDLQDPSGYPSSRVLEKIDPAFKNLLETKLRHPVISLGQKAGTLSAAAAELLSLPEGIPTGIPTGIPVASFMVDAHSSLLGSGIEKQGELFLILGTSGCSMICDENRIPVPGICGSVRGGILPGLYGYEAGQPSLGDLFGWFADGFLNASLQAEADERGLGAHEILTEKASLLKPGESGLVALDWWNGNRSTLDDSDLSGLILGLTGRTRPEEIYRALLEAAAFGIRTIADNYRSHGISIDRILAGGSVSLKNPLFMQILSDVLGQSIRIPQLSQASARGAALLGARACGLTVKKADIPEKVYQPQKEHMEIYEQLYGIYSELYGHFGKKAPALMHHLKDISARSRTGSD